MCLEEGGLKVVLPGRGVSDLPWRSKSLPVEPEVRETTQINYKMNFIQDSFQRFSQHLHSTFH